MRLSWTCIFSLLDSWVSRKDEELIQRANQGESEAFEALYFKYRDYVFSLAYKLSGNEHDANDILQDVFIYFFNKFPGFELRAQLKTFLYPVVKNTYLTLKRKGHKESAHLNEAMEISVEVVNLKDEERELLAHLKHLNAAQQEVFLLRFGQGFELSEISETLNIPLGTVKSRIHKGLALLKEKIKKN